MYIAAFIVGWALGSVSLYAYLVATAKEPVRNECMECHRMECSDCPHVTPSAQELKRAA